MDITFTVKGAKELITRLTNTAIVKTELTDAATKSAAVVQERAMTYPPQRPGSTYRRTRRLGNSWAFQVRAFGSEVRATVRNPVDYGKYVHDPRQQAEIHKGVWATTIEMLAEKKQVIIGFFTVARNNILKRLGGG